MDIKLQTKKEISFLFVDHKICLKEIKRKTKLLQTLISLQYLTKKNISKTAKYCNTKFI